MVTTNIEMAGIVNQWDLPKDIGVTWFRSDWMRGVTVENKRIMICIGGPYLPKTAYVPEAHSFDFKDFAQKLEDLPAEKRVVQISKILSADDTKSEFINAIGRVKDHTARERSLVITLGMNCLDVQAMLKQTTKPLVSRPHLTKPLRKGGMLRDGVWIAKLWLDRLPYGYMYINVEDLPWVARIIRCTRNRTKIRASEIVLGMKDVVVEKAKQYENVLSWFNVRLVEKRGGVSFCWINVSLDHFSCRWPN